MLTNPNRGCAARTEYVDADSPKKGTGPLQQAEITTLAGLRPWREVVQPHPDVASGRYVQAEFAADLAQVLVGTAEPEYQDPVEFFRRTYLTEGLLALLVTGVQRLTAQPDAAAVAAAGAVPSTAPSTAAGRPLPSSSGMSWRVQRSFTKIISSMVSALRISMDRMRPMVTRADCNVA